MKVYLCGGINGLSDDEAKSWREDAKRDLAAHGIECLDPMRRDYRGKEDDNISDIVLGDRDDIDNCDAVLAMCTRPSWGTAMEMFYAHSRNRPVLAVVGPGKVSPWLRYHTNVHRSMVSAIASLLSLQEWLRGR